MPDMRKQKGRDNGKRGKAFAMSKDRAYDLKRAIPYKNFRVQMRENVQADWEYLNQFGYTGSRVFEEGVKACMNQLVAKRIDERLYGEFEAFVMYKRRKTKHGIKLEKRKVRAKLHHTAKSFERIIIISLSPCPKGGNKVIVRYFKVNKQGTIKRDKIHSMSKKVEFIDENILLFFANGGNHSD